MNELSRMELKDITPAVIGVPLLVLIILTGGIIFYIALAVLFLFVAADYARLHLRLSELKKITVNRAFTSRDLGLGSKTVLTTTFNHAGHSRLILNYRQPVGPDINISGNLEGQIEVSHRKPTAFIVELKPLKGGQHRIQPIIVTVESLFFRDRIVLGRVETITAHLVTGRIAGHTQLSLGSDRRFSDVGSYSGRHGRGGTDFSTIRTYLPGDETRHIDWARSSRTNHLVIKEFESDLSQPVFFLVDADPSMGSGSTSDFCAALGVVTPLISKLLVENGRFGVACFSGKGVVSYQPLGMGREHSAKALAIFSRLGTESGARLVKGEVPLHEASSLRVALSQAEGLGVLGTFMDETLREYRANIDADGFTRAIIRISAPSKIPCQIIIITNLSMGLGGLMNGIRIAKFYGHSVVVVLTPHVWSDVGELVDPEKAYEKYAEVKNSISKIKGYGHVTVIDLNSAGTGGRETQRGSSAIQIKR